MISPVHLFTHGTDSLPRSGTTATMCGAYAVQVAPCLAYNSCGRCSVCLSTSGDFPTPLRLQTGKTWAKGILVLVAAMHDRCYRIGLRVVFPQHCLRTNARSADMHINDHCLTPPIA